MKHYRASGLLISFLLICIPFYESFAQEDSISHRIILIGDAGYQVNGKQPELELIKKNFSLDSNTTVLFLGDNVYPQGLPSTYARNYEEKRAILDSQINLVLDKGARSFIISGNHDWMQGRAGGFAQVRNQINHIQSRALPNVQYLPSDGCPGPELVELNKNTVLVVIDSQWWLHRHEKPGVTYSCDTHDEYELLESLKNIVSAHEDKLLIFAAHHPFITYGRHGGYYSLKQHIFPFTEMHHKLYIPLPVIGSLYPLVRGVFGNIQDTRHPVYKSFSRSVDSILSQHPYCIRVAGHEHNLQLIEQSGQYYIVSGAGSKISDLSRDKNLIFGATQTGFSVVELVDNGNVWVRFYSSMTDSTSLPIYSSHLPALDSTPIVPKLYDIPNLPDSITAVANPRYKANSFKKWLLGENYRDEWTTPVRLKVFDIGKEKGGLKITRRGGGMQTRSLRLEDKDGTEYVLRSIEKFPDKTLPEEFRQTFVKDAVVDGISASYPYGALSIPTLSEAVKVPHIKPSVVYIPDDPRLGAYRKEFGNSMALYEETEPGNYEKNSGTDRMLERLQKDHDNLIDQKSVLKVRLLDMFIMDFDRHEDQWRWVTNDTGKRKTFLPIPRDRDQAFFVNEGFIPKMLSKPSRFPKFQGFKAEARDITNFNQNAVHFDRTFLHELTREDWEILADSLIGTMTDSVIETALKKQPPEIFPYSGEKIIQTLKERRNYIKKEAIEYYEFLSKEVDIPGSDKGEFFDVKRNVDGSVTVTVYELSKEREVKNQIYGRTFFPDLTKELRLYGRSGEDSFYISGESEKTIRIRIIGGRGEDHFINNSNAARKNTVLYDFLNENNKIEGQGLFKRELSRHIGVNDYNRKAFQYDRLSPGLTAGYNRDDGISVGLSLRYIAHGFRKDPYKIMHYVHANYALASRALLFGYNMEAIGAIGSSDLVIESWVGTPRYALNFFGFGNNSVNEENESGFKINYYRTRLDFGSLSTLLRRQVAPDITLAYGPSFQFAGVKRSYNNRTILTLAPPEGIDTADLFQRKTYLGPRIKLEIDNRNSLVLPSRGLHWKTEYSYHFGLGKHSESYGNLNSDLTMYISSNRPAKLVFAVRIGGGITSGDYEYFQSQFLSGNTNLRGYRRFRFAGDKSLFNNFEVRYKIKDFRTYLLPGALGVLAFHDIGRVWYKNEKSGRWHNGYGGGIWLAPAERLVGTLSLAHSREGFMGIASLGWQF